MSTDHQEGYRITALLASESGEGSAAAHTAQGLIATWQVIDDALTPVIGARGLMALYLRALHLTALDPALAPTGHPGKLALNAATTPVLLQDLIARQSPAHASAIGNTFLQVFHGLLSSLVGPSLTERLLRAVWTTSLSSTSAQEQPP